MRRSPDPLALTAIEAAEMRLAEQRELAGLAVFRLRLQATILAVSPFVRDLAAMHGYPIFRVAQLSDGAASLVSFRTGLIDDEMPWQDMLAAEMERRS